MKLPSKTTLTKMMLDPPERWHGRCHQASTAVACLIPNAKVRRGYFTGKIDVGAYFDGRPCQHSWVELADGRVLDPTRFAFTNEPAWPMWIGPPDEYDIGGCRTMPHPGPPPDPYDTTNLAGKDDDYIELHLNCVAYVAGLLGTPSEMCLDTEYDDEDSWVEVTPKQAHWLAHLPIDDKEDPRVLCRFFAAEVYEALIGAGQGALIPIDRRSWILDDC